MKYFLIFLAVVAVLVFPLVLGAEISFERWYGGSDPDMGNSVQQTTDGGYIITGWTRPSVLGTDDVYLIKTDSLGDTLWTKTFGGPANDQGNSVQQTTDGGYIIAGKGQYYSGFPYNVYLIKTDSLGDTLWTKTYGGDFNDAGLSVQQTTDGGYIITGYTNSSGAGWSDVWLIKTNSVGDALFTRTFGGTYRDQGRSVQQTTDEGYIIAGWTDSYGAGSYDVYLIKTNIVGVAEWTKTFGGTLIDQGYSVQQTTDGGYIIAGLTQSYGAGNRDFYLIKTNSLGNTLWTKTFGGYNHDYGYSVQQTTDEGYIITGETRSYGAGGSDVYLIKTDANGDALWTKTFGGTVGDVGNSVRQTTDGGYIIAGYTGSFGAGSYDVYLIKTGESGNVGIETPLFTATSESYYIKLQWRLEMENACLQYLIIRKSIKENEDYCEIARIPGSGSSPSPMTYSYKDEDVKPGIRYYYKLGVVKTDGKTEWYGPVSAVVTGIKPFLSISPNPFTTSTTITFSLPGAQVNVIELSIYDVSGRLVKDLSVGIRHLASGRSIVSWDGRDNSNRELSSGVYFLKFKTGDYAETRKVLMVR